MKENKKYDAVQEMREIREKLSLKYWKNPEALMKDMEAVRKKHNLQIRDTKKHSS
jgi:chitinase